MDKKKALTFEIVREIIQIKSVKADLLKNNVGYLRLTSFNENSGDQIREQIREFEKKWKYKFIYTRFKKIILEGCYHKL